MNLVFFDIALIKLSTTVNPNLIKPINLPPRNWFTNIYGTEFPQNGYGMGGTIFDLEQKIPEEVSYCLVSIDKNRCLYYEEIALSSMWKDGFYIEAVKTPKLGEMGSPLMVKKNEKMILIGLASGRYSERTRTLYTYVSSFDGWIKEKKRGFSKYNSQAF